MSMIREGTMSANRNLFPVRRSGRGEEKKRPTRPQQPWFGPAAMPGELGGMPKEGKASFFTFERGRGMSRDATKIGTRSPSRESVLSNAPRMTGLSEKSRKIVGSVLLRREQAKEEKRRRERVNVNAEMAAYATGWPPSKGKGRHGGQAPRPPRHG
ncbi:MAG: hypothetical protein BJ554DRAFT_7513 [Olpidium bornovanus]|uniref:Uncharacterized protein n=1 Tax=Olpidium bornovanus TaxID=278681 RepID=A0A8H7ZWA7_9FUNG|nr:MAG: hypothetical protein BJ554DRAFT_7513 [Olpidium bornovanus]